MATETKQKQKRCRDCGRKTLHIATIQQADMGCGMHVLMSVLTLGLWIPVGILLVGLGTLANAMAPMGAKYHCQVCGRAN